VIIIVVNSDRSILPLLILRLILVKS
jgi:hypothetical protein